MNTLARKFGHTATASHGRTSRFRSRQAFVFAILCLLGALVILYPYTAMGTVAVVVALGLLWWAFAWFKRIGLEVWQGVLLIALTGYMLLNYGFENIAIHLGPFPFIVSYGLMYLCLGLALHSSRGLITRSLKEPVILCFLALLLLTIFHLLLDVPSFGLWALRDSTMVLDGLFLFLGLLWAMRPKSLGVLRNWLMVVFVLNMIYCFTFPWHDKILEWSPASGVFMDVSIVGQYHTTDIYLLLGAAFCLGSGAYVLKQRRWLILFLAMAQLLGLAVIQARAAYVALVAITLILLAIGERKKAWILIGMLSSAVIVLVLVTGVGGVQLSGRIGPINLDFIKDHIRSITGEKVTEASSVESRFEFASEAMEHFRSSPVFGVGFGQALVSYIDEETGATVRVPHNSNLTVMTRLGIVGLAIWLLFNIFLLREMIRALRHRVRYDPQVYEFIEWTLIFYATFMIAALVEGPLETPSSAIPFYFFMGLGLGFMRWNLLPKKDEVRFSPGS